MSSLFVNDNIASLNAQQNLTETQQKIEKHVQRLSSGYRVNTPKDSPAEYAISQRMGGAIDSYGAAIHNAQDGNNLLETASGALRTENDILLKMRELAVRAANSTFSPKDLHVMNQEYEHLKKELTRVASVTEFNGIKLLNGSHKHFTFHVGIGTALADRLRVHIDSTDAKSLGVHSTEILRRETAKDAIAALDHATEKLNAVQGNVGAVQDRMEWTIRNLNAAQTNTSASRAGIRDADFAKETAAYVKQQILAQSGAAVLSRANQAPKNVLNLLG